MCKNISIKKAVFVLFLLTIAVISSVSCKSTQEIPEDLSAKQLIQSGQDAFENYKYKLALDYFNAVIDRYGDTDMALYVEAKYEIGHLYMKQKKQKLAKPVFEEILEIYSSVLPGTIPAAYQKLSQIELEKIKI